MRKKIFYIFLLFCFACQNKTDTKPKNLIEKNKMMLIMYDMSVAEAITYYNPNHFVGTKETPVEWIYRKYNIDSLSYTQSNTYYASYYEDYKDMFEQVSKRMKDTIQALDSVVKYKEKHKAEKEKNSLKKQKN